MKAERKARDPRKSPEVVTTPHEFVNSNPDGFDSNCAECEGKHRDAIHHQNEGVVNAAPDTIDNTPDAVVESGSINSQPSEETKMTETTEDHSSYAETLNPMPKPVLSNKEMAKAEREAKKAAAAAEKLAAKEAKKEAAELAKAEKLAAKLEAIQSKNQSTKEEREAAKLERAERLAALNPDGTRKYVGSMLALADRVKQGAYVKGATGQLRSTNELAEVLDAVPVANVIQLAKIVLGLDANPYTHLNSGQQSMNLRSKMRGAIKAGTLTIDTIRECIATNDFATATDWEAKAQAKREARAAAAAANKAEKEAKAAARAVKATEPAEETAEA